MRKLLFISLLFLPCFCFGQNLITNPSFEDSLGNPSLNGWYQWGQFDTLYFDSSANVPAGGGNWSVRLATDFPQTHHLAWFVTGMQGTNVYQLSVWADKTVAWYIQGPPVIIAMGVIDTGYYTYPSCMGWNPSFNGIIFDSIPFSWANVTLIDTLTTQATDTIAVILMGGTTINGPYDFVYYDLAELTVLNNLTSIKNSKNIQTQRIKIYPNPTDGKFTVSGAGEIQVYDLFGRLLLRSNKQKIDMSSYPAGLYIWQIGSARGKLVLE